jgi:pyrimidine deaminase RibD-like protein
MESLAKPRIGHHAEDMGSRSTSRPVHGATARVTLEPTNKAVITRILKVEEVQ